MYVRIDTHNRELNSFYRSPLIEVKKEFSLPGMVPVTEANDQTSLWVVCSPWILMLFHDLLHKATEEDMSWMNVQFCVYGVRFSVKYLHPFG